MKYVISILLILSFYLSTAQPIVNIGTPAVTQQLPRGKFGLSGYMVHTHGLTLNGGLDSLGAFIYEDSSGHVWYRDTVLSGGHKWTMQAIGPPGGQDTIVIQNTPSGGGGIPRIRVSGDTAYTRKDSAGAGIAIDTTTRPGMNIWSATGVTPTLQQVFNTQVGGSVLTKNDSIIAGTHYLMITGSSTNSTAIINNSSSGSGLTINANGSGEGLSVNANGGVPIDIEQNGTGNLGFFINNGTGGGVTIATQGNGSSTLSVQSSGVGNPGISVTTSGGSDGVDIQVNAGLNPALQATSVFTPITATYNNSNNSAPGNVLVLYDLPTGTPAIGHGASIETDLRATSGAANGLTIASRQIISATDVSAGNFTSKYQLFLRSAGSLTGTPQLVVLGSGQAQLPYYTSSSSFPVTPVGMLVYDASGNVGTQAISGGGGGGIGLDSTVTITSGTSSTVTNGFNQVVVDFSGGPIANYTLTLPTTWHTSNTVRIFFGHTNITSGAVITGTFTIINGSGQTLLQFAIPGSFNAGEEIEYHLVGTVDHRVK